jgi:hypothetical protein
MASTHAVAATGTKNDTGRVIQGNPTGTRFVNLSLVDTASDSQKHGSPTVSATLGNQAGISGRAFAKTRAGQYIIRGFSTKVAGVTDNTFRSPGHPSTAVAPSFAKLETLKTGFLSASAWTSVSKDLPTYTHTQSAKTMSAGTDRWSNHVQRD